jgi:anti-anti-sigma factor
MERGVLMQVHCTIEAGYTLTISGEVEDSEIPRFRQELDRLIHKGCQEGKVLVDLSRVDFLTGMGFALLLNAKSELASKGLELDVMHSTFTAHIAQKLGLDRISEMAA